MGMICDITTSLEQTSTLAQKEVEQEKHRKHSRIHTNRESIQQPPRAHT